MTTKEIADRLISFCEKDEYETAQKELYSKDIVSIEPLATPDFEKETKGLDAVIEKGKKFEAMTEQSHSNKISAPLIAGNVIAFTLTMDITMKGKERATWEELCVYQVKDGKIILEQFFM